MKTTIITLLALVSLSLGLSIRPDFPVLDQSLEQFKDFQATYNKVYANDVEASLRFGIFKDNLKKIEELNKQSTATFGVNEFADLTSDEFRAARLSSKAAVKDKTWPVAPEYSQEHLAGIPTSVDWRDKGAVTDVKNQGSCGSCWSFSTTGNIEGQWFLAGNTLTSLSEQNLVDCDHECMQYENQTSCDAGCDGGLQPNAYTYVIKNGGIDTEASYPYQGTDGTCSFQKSNVGAKINNFTMISEDETQMAAYLAEHGPIAIAADAVEWQFYIGGVFDLPCGKTLDHGILIVGYGNQTNILGHDKDYWIVKNSWGGSWGEKGYLKIERGVGKCGLNLFASSSIITPSQ